ncbi:MAG TPA: globin domain-containing protein [Streptosporangiaceae bacterium]|nr:globin domain-containing protein [Streptosporangiaceae bacterium]
MTKPYGRIGAAHGAAAIPGQVASAESSARQRAGTEGSEPAADFDAKLVKKSFAHAAAVGPAVMEFFYTRLFAESPDIRSLFPMTMTPLREHVFASLTEVIATLDSQPDCAELLGRLGRDHRRFGVRDRHHQAFFAAMVETAQHFIGTDWRPEVESAWRGAVGYICATMQAAAAQAAGTPAWWIAEIVGHELRSPGVAVVTLAPSQPLRYLPGQYVPVQVTRWPRVWRPFSVANAPRSSGLIELHVRAVPGGLVSNSLVYHSAEGDTVLLGSADGGMTLTDSGRDLLCVAGSTGLAPIKALIEQVISESVAEPQRKITLFYGARQQFDLYDLQDLQLLESAYAGLRVVTVLSEEPGFSGLKGTLPDVLHAHGTSVFGDTEAYICGPEPMVRQTAALLAATIPADRIHYDPVR